MRNQVMNRTHEVLHEGLRCLFQEAHVGDAGQDVFVED